LQKAICFYLNILYSFALSVTAFRSNKINVVKKAALNLIVYNSYSQKFTTHDRKMKSLFGNEKNALDVAFRISIF